MPIATNPKPMNQILIPFPEEEMRLAEINCARCTALWPAVAGKPFKRENKRDKWECAALTIPITLAVPGDPLKRGDAKADGQEDCGPERRVWDLQSEVHCYGNIVPITSAHGAWAERGGTITRTTFRLSTGGATERRDRPEGDEEEGAFYFTELLCPPV
jgi:hypothetical protein